MLDWDQRVPHGSPQLFPTNQSPGAHLRKSHAGLQKDLKMISGDDESFIQWISRGGIIMPDCESS